MPELTRRRSPDRQEPCWLIYYGDVHCGTIAERTGNPFDTEQWEWRCGFYPGSDPGECSSGVAKIRAGLVVARQLFVYLRQREFEPRRTRLRRRGMICSGRSCVIAATTFLFL
jgi:hypothetical protein